MFLYERAPWLAFRRSRRSFAGYWGEVLTVAAEAAGIAALVIDGGVRDIAALTAR